MNTAEITNPVAVHSILFATDFSDAAQRAQSYATALSNRFRAKLVVAHANEPPNYGLRPENWRAANEEVAAKMREVEKSVRAKFPCVKSDFCIDEGTAWSVVDSLVGKREIDLVIVGTRGRTGMGKLLLGSQSEEIFRHAACPVLTVGPNAAPVKGGENELEEILYATDFSPAAQASAAFAFGMAFRLGAHMNLLHVVEEPKTSELVRPEEVLTSSERLLHSLMPEGTEFWREPRYFAERGEPAQKILEVAERVHAGMIVLGVHKPGKAPGAAVRTGTGVAYKVACAATCPVLTIRG